MKSACPGLIPCTPAPSRYVGLTPHEVQVLNDAAGAFFGAWLLVMFVLLVLALTIVLVLVTRS